MTRSRCFAVTLLGLGVGFAACAASAQPVRLAPRVMLTATQQTRLQSVADEGPEALRRYLWRTRMIYGWTWQDLVAGE
jgi:hypothetical protein